MVPLCEMHWCTVMEWLSGTYHYNACIYLCCFRRLHYIVHLCGMPQSEVPK